MRVTHQLLQTQRVRPILNKTQKLVTNTICTYRMSKVDHHVRQIRTASSPRQSVQCSLISFINLGCTKHHFSHVTAYVISRCPLLIADICDRPSSNKPQFLKSTEPHFRGMKIGFTAIHSKLMRNMHYYLSVLRLFLIHKGLRLVIWQITKSSFSSLLRTKLVSVRVTKSPFWLPTLRISPFLINLVTNFSCLESARFLVYNCEYNVDGANRCVLCNRLP